MDTFENVVLQNGDHLSQEYDVKFSNRVIHTTVTKYPAGIRRWIQALKPTLQRGSRIALSLKATALKRSTKPVACAFLSGDSCLLVSFDKKKKKVPNVIIEFLLDYYVFVGVEVWNAMDILLEGVVLSKSEGEPTLIDLNTVAANHYANHALLRADLHSLCRQVFQRAPSYPKAEERHWDCPSDNQVAAITSEAALVCALLENINVPVPVNAEED